MTKTIPWCCAAALAIGVGCGTSPTEETAPYGDANPATPVPTTPTTPADGGSDGATPGASACGPAVCTAWNEQSKCTVVGGLASWTRATCASAEGCVRGTCTPNACSDDCRLGESGCALHEVSSGAPVTVNPTKMHDRARAFEKWIQGDTRSYFHNQIVSVKYDSAALGAVSSIYVSDSALHTGIYLAGEAHRLMATGAVQARKNVRDMVDNHHVLFNVSGDPGMIATNVFPAGDPDIRAWNGWNCTDFDRHCDAAFGGKKWDYQGQPSRDMYMGPLLGLVAAYDALGAFDEDRRKLIRQDLMTWAKELVKKRVLPVRLVLNGIKLPVQNTDARFFIPEKLDMVDGAVEIQLSASDAGSGQVRSRRDFMPNPSLLFRKFAALSALPDIPRSTSALMVGGIIQAALHVSDGAPEYAADRKALRDFYDNNNDEWGNAKSWIGVAATQTASAHSCDAAYFGHGLAWIAAYTWALLEEVPAVKNDLFTRVIDGKMWPEVSAHKNSFFTFAYGATKKATPVGTALADAVRQVASFPAPPRVRVAKTGACSDTAVEIGDRPITYNQWHANPWSQEDSGNAKQTYPGQDYVIAYWMGRSYQLIAEDTPSHCLHR